MKKKVKKTVLPTIVGTSMLEQSIGTTMLAIVAKMPECPRGLLFSCALAAKTLSHAHVTLFEHARDARTSSVTPYSHGP